MTDEEARAILNAPKDGEYDPSEAITLRTNMALDGDREQLRYDGIDVTGFLELEFPLYAQYVSGLSDYRVLDVGCGYGRFCRFLSGFDCAYYAGIDPNRDRLRYARDRHGRFWISGNVVFEVFTPDKYREGVSDLFDVVYCRTVIQHLFLDEKLRVLAGIRRLVKSGGLVFLQEGGIWEYDLIECAERYLKPEQAVHMIPMPLELVEGVFQGSAWLFRGGEFIILKVVK